MKKLVFLFAMVFAVIMAMGQSNESTVTVGGDNNIATIVQTGLDNFSNLSQSKNNIFDLEQIGNDNFSNFRQAQTGSNEAYVDQLGNNNTLAGILQGESNLLNLLQQGDDNWARVYQDARNHEADIVQDGNWNKAEVVQDAPSSIIDIDLIGDYNETYVNQQNSTAANINEAVVNVTGSNNGDATYGDVRLEIRQDGEGNYASTLISGDYNDSDISQTGNLNQAWADVTGDINIVDVMQAGDSNISTSTIAGDGNTVTVTQGPTPTPIP